MTGRHGTGLLFGALAVVAVAGSAMLDAVGLTFGRCPFAAVTGLPCPTCFTTRAFLALGRGEVTTAFAFQPLAVSAAFFLVVWGVASAAPPLHPALESVASLIKKNRHALLIALPSLVALNWFYLFAHR